MRCAGRIALVRVSGGAEQGFARALELEPKEASALSGLALVHQAQGDLGKAIVRMKEAAEADRLRGVRVHGGSHDADRAIAPSRVEKFEAILREHPESVGAANDLAFLLAEDAADLPRAQQYAERAVRLRPSAETLDTLGFVKLREGAAEEAVGMFERALARRPDYATARYHLALALVEKGEPRLRERPSKRRSPNRSRRNRRPKGVGANRLGRGSAVKPRLPNSRGGGSRWRRSAACPRRSASRATSSALASIEERRSRTRR